MSFHDVRFPDSIAEGAEGGPSYSTSVVTTSGGYEQRQANWAVGRGTWNVGTGLKDEADIAITIAFFRARRGRLNSFRFKDWSDYELARQAIGTTDGTDATWQVFKNYTSGPTTVARPLTKLVSGTVRCWVNASEITLGAGAGEFTVDLATGMITLGATLAATTGQVIEAECEFDVPARFDIDRLGLRLQTFRIGDVPDIPIIEVME